MTRPAIFRYFKTSPEIIRIAVMMYVRFPLSLRNVEDLLHERGIGITHETARVWWGGSGRCLPPRSGAPASTPCAPIAIAAGISTRSS